MGKIIFTIVLVVIILALGIGEQVRSEERRVGKEC